MDVAEEITLEVVDPRSAEAVFAMTSYFDELDARFPGGFDPGDAVESGAGGFTPPAGVFVVARLSDTVVGCGGVQRIDPLLRDPAGTSVGEIKRMWVADTVRGRGLGRRLLADLEERAWAAGHTIVRLDTNEALSEAIAMYRRAGYVEIERYNDNPYPTHFFEKRRPNRSDGV